MHDPNLPFGERRLHERKTCMRTVRIEAGDASYNGHLRDLALGGAFIEPPQDNDVRIGQNLMLTIPFGLKKERLTLQAKVAWVKSSGIGVRFTKP